MRKRLFGAQRAESIPTVPWLPPSAPPTQAGAATVSRCPVRRCQADIYWSACPRCGAPFLRCTGCGRAYSEGGSLLPRCSGCGNAGFIVQTTLDSW